MIGLIQWTGELKNGQWYNGQGTVILENGTRYEGHWNNGKMHGEVTITYPDGRKFIGRLNNGTKDGQGTIIYTDGRKYSSPWENDRFLFKQP